MKLPYTTESDAWVEANSIAIATHGRGFYVLDDIAPLRQGAAGRSTFYLYKPADAIRTAGGATISYTLKQPAQDLRIEILRDGQVVQTIRGAQPSSRPGQGATTPTAGGQGEGEEPATGGGRGRGGPPTASMAAGFNRVTWNLEYPGPTAFPGMVLWGASTSGPMALPGTYDVRLTVDGQSQVQRFAIRKHPWHADSDEELIEQFDLAIEIRDKVSEANNAVIQIRKIKEQIKDRLSKSQDGQLKAAGDRLIASLSAIEEEIYQVRNQSNQDPLNFPIKINNRLASLLGVVSRGEGKPIAAAYPILKDLTAELKVQTDRLREVLATDLTAFNTEAKRAGVEVIGT
jgi:hypothetical protein